MEELSIEEKTKRYDEALERAKKLQETCDSTAVVGWCEYIFPELKESEDEEIRKGLIKAVSRIFEDHKLFDTDVTREEALAWLEKQRHMLDPDKVIEWLENKQPSVGVYYKFKKDFGL